MNQNKYAVITGGSRGIGFAIAEYLSSIGFTLLLIARDEENLKKAINKLGQQHEYTAIDVANYDDVNNAITSFVQKTKKIDLLVNSAGYVKRGTSTLSPIEFQKMLDANLVGLFNAIHSSVPYMKNQKHGRIINIASYSGVMARAPLGGYAASKFAVMGLNESLYKELSSEGISVTAICPNLVDTDMTADVNVSSSDKIPTSDIVKAVDFLLNLSPSSSIKEIVIQCRYKLINENK